MSDLKIIGMIPARVGSERLKLKNLRLLGGKPVIAHAIEAARESGMFERIVLNSDGEAFAKIAKRYDIDFYHRTPDLANSQAKSDDVVADFMGRYAGDILVWLNPIAPLQPASEIRSVIEYFIEQDLDSLITVKDEQVHCLYDGRPINFSEQGLFAKTQDLVPVQSMVYSIMMWRYETFLSHYQEHGYALLSGKPGYYSVCRDSTIIIKREEDLRIAEAILQSRLNASDNAEYDLVAKNIVTNDG
jgi:CMP-N-acetylneuraminic acid synthetase